MNHSIVIIATALFCAAVSAQAQTSIKPASIYDQDGITVVSPSQTGWTLLKTDRSKTFFAKRGEGGILNANVKTIEQKLLRRKRTGWLAGKRLNKKN